MRYSIRESQSKLMTCLEESQSQTAKNIGIDGQNHEQKFIDPKLLGEDLSTITKILEKLVHFQKVEKDSDLYKLSDLKWSVGEL